MDGQQGVLICIHARAHTHTQTQTAVAAEEDGGVGRLIDNKLIDSKGEMEELADKGALSNFFERLETELEMRAYANTEDKRRVSFPKIRNVRISYVCVYCVCVYCI